MIVGMIVRMIGHDIVIIGVDLKALGIITAPHNTHLEVVVWKGEVVRAVGIEDLKEVESNALVVAITVWKNITPTEVSRVSARSRQTEVVVDALLYEGVLDSDDVL